jgi:hypothetical protein
MVCCESTQPWNLLRIARLEGSFCCAVCDIKSVCKQSGCTVGRLGSTGLLTMPSKGLHSRHSGDYLQLIQQQGPATINDNYGQAGSC